MATSPTSSTPVPEHPPAARDAGGAPPDGPRTPPDMPPAQLEAWRTFLQAHARVIEVLTRELKATEELPLTWYDVLVQLQEAPEHRLRMQELADAVLLSKSGVTRLVDRMERDGLVTRSRCADDRRGTFAQLTDAGRQRLRATAPTHLEGVQRYFTSLLDEDEARTLTELLSRVIAAAHTEV